MSDPNATGSITERDTKDTRYNRSEKGRERQARYDRSEKGRARKKAYRTDGLAGWLLERKGQLRRRRAAIEEKLNGTDT